MLRDDVFRIALHSREKSGKNRLFTNGYLVDRTRAVLIREAFDIVRVSLDGPDEETHKAHRGDGRARVVEAIETLVSAGARVEIACTVTRLNMRRLGEMLQVARRLGAPIAFSPFMPLGRGLAAKNSFGVSGEEYYRALASISRLVKDWDICEELWSRAGAPLLKCGIGDSVLSIDELGDVYPCHLAHCAGLRCGNVLDGELRYIIEQSATLRRVRALDVRRFSGCSGCAYRFLCGGCCRARAFRYGDGLGAADPFCEHVQLSIREQFIR